MQTIQLQTWTVHSYICWNGRAGHAYTADFSIISKTLNLADSKTQGGTTATINMYREAQMIGSQDAQIVCSLAVNNGSLSIRSVNCTLYLAGQMVLTGTYKQQDCL